MRRRRQVEFCHRNRGQQHQRTTHPWTLLFSLELVGTRRHDPSRNCLCSGRRGSSPFAMTSDDDPCRQGIRRSGGRVLPLSDPLPLCGERDFKVLGLASIARLLEHEVGVIRGVTTLAADRRRQDRGVHVVFNNRGNLPMLHGKGQQSVCPDALSRDISEHTYGRRPKLRC